MLRVVTDEDARAEMRSSLDEIVLEGERRMLAAALEAEVDGYIADLADQRDAGGRRLVVRNGHARPRTATTAAGGSKGLTAGRPGRQDPGSPVSRAPQG